MSDIVNNPPHYTAHPSGIECIQVAEHMGFNLGNAIKYIWRADLKGNALEDLKKAAWYVQREIQRRTPAPTCKQCGSVLSAFGHCGPCENHANAEMISGGQPE